MIDALHSSRTEVVEERPPYAFVCVDRSLLVRPFCRYVVQPFAQWVPAGVPANYITLISSACMWLMLALVVGRPTAALAPWCLALMCGYVIYDHADGMHARRTGTSGPLGEYLDHFLDVFHAAIAVIAAAAVSGLAGSPWLPLVLWAVLLGSAATMVEQLERRELFFGVLGPLEGMLVMMAFFAAWCPAGAAEWWSMPVWGLTRLDLAFAIGGAGGLVPAIACVRRIGRVPWSLATYAVASGGLIWALVGSEVGSTGTMLLVMLHGSDYVGRVIGCHLRGGSRPWPDLVAPTAAAFVSLSGVGSEWLGMALALYLAVRNVGAIARTVHALRRGWRWWNPPAVAA